MSAIVGIYQSNHEPVQPGLGERVMQTLQRYPADDVRTWHDEHVFLGCHAQWITPESVNERLPHYDYERGLAVTADAILDNRDELFEKLQVRQSDRRDMPDSSLILLAYQKWGKDAPVHFIGDFAFLIWDSRNHTLFGARDFSGNRTLYYARTRERFAFSTTIQPLFTLPGLDKRINEQWLSEFLAIPTTTECVDLFTTVYQHIGQIPPAHTVSVSNGEMKFTKYCKVAADHKLKLKTNEEYEEAFRDVFQKAVASRLRTHRQVGAYLSGGLDSGSVASFAARTLRDQDKPLHTFSYVPLDDFQDWTPRSRIANERENIKSTVNHVGNIHDQYFEFPEMNPLSEVNNWLDIMEEPYKFYENSYWLRGIYQKAHDRNVGILLSGSRGNWTVSWGPALDYQASLLRSFRWIRFYKEFQQYSAGLGAIRSRVIRIVGKKAFPRIAKLLSSKREPDLPDLINPEFAKRTNVYERLRDHGYDFWGDPLQNVYEVRKKQFENPYYWSLTGKVGCKQSLRHSLWERDPTNDLRVIRFCLSVPEDQFVHNGLDRALIRRSTKNYLPDQIRLNRKVRGIQGADGVHRMMHSWNRLTSELQLVIEDPSVSGYLNIKELKNAFTSIQKDPRPELIFDTEFRILMRSLIFYRFMKSYT